MKEVVIRRATVEDIDTLVELRQAMRQDIERVEDEEQTKRLAAANRAYFWEKLAKDEFVAFLAEVDGRAVGTSGLVLYQRPPTSRNLRGIDGYILNMYTAPEWRRKGIATSLLTATVDAAKGAGANVIWLRAMEAGRQVYERAGFKEHPSYLELRT